MSSKELHKNEVYCNICGEKFNHFIYGGKLLYIWSYHKEIYLCVNHSSKINAAKAKIQRKVFPLSYDNKKPLWKEILGINHYAYEFLGLPKNVCYHNREEVHSKQDAYWRLFKWHVVREFKKLGLDYNKE